MMHANETDCAATAEQRLSAGDRSLQRLWLNERSCTAAEAARLVDVIAELRPAGLLTLEMRGVRLTDADGVKLAGYLAASASVEDLLLANNHFGDATYLAMAEALRHNTSLTTLYLHSAAGPVDQARCDRAFVQALQLNHRIPDYSDWQLYKRIEPDYDRLKECADQLGHPTMQLLLAFIDHPRNHSRNEMN